MNTLRTKPGRALAIAFTMLCALVMIAEAPH